MYQPMPPQIERLDDLARKIGSLADALHNLRSYMHRDDNRKPTSEEELIISTSRMLFDQYSNHVDEFESEFIAHMQAFEIWRRSVQENGDLVTHMGPMVPASERRTIPRPGMPAPSHSETYQPPEWTLTEAELAAKAESELESILSGNK